MRHRMLSACLVAGAMAWAAGLVAAGAEPGKPGEFDWPMVSGDAGGTGFSPDTRVKPPFRLKWATQPGAVGKHDFVVADGKVFTPNCCLDAETGGVLWKADLAGSDTVPSYFKGRLYSVGKGNVNAYDASNGKPLWKKPGYSSPFFPSRNGLPVCDGAVYCGQIKDHEGKKFYFACALDAENGNELWATPLVPTEGKVSGGYEISVRMGTAAVGDGWVLATTHSPSMVFALNQKTGKELWRQEGIFSLDAMTTDGGIACAADHVQGLWVLDAGTGKRLWHWGGSDKSREKANYAATGTAKRPPAIFGEVIVTSNYGGEYTALDRKTGELLWVAGGGKAGEYNGWAGGCGAPVIAAGHIYSTGLRGTDYNGKRLRFGLYAVDHKTGKPVWKHPTSGRSCARVAIAGGRLYARGGTTEVTCFEPVPPDYKPPEPQAAPAQPAGSLAELAKPIGGKPGEAAAGEKPKGGSDWPMYGSCPERCGLEVDIKLPIKEAWKFSTGGKVQSSPVIAGGVCYVGSDSGQLFAVDLASGKEKWKAEVGSWIKCAPAVVEGIVVCGADDGVLRAFDAKSGAPKWEFKTAGRIRASPAIIGERVVFGSWDGHCYCVRLSDGKEFWRFRVGDPGIRVHTAPAVANGRVYVGAWEDYAIHGLDLGTGKPLAGYDINTPSRGAKSPKLGLVQGLAAYRGLVVTCSGDETGCVLDAATGKILAETGRPSELPALPAFSGGSVYHPCSSQGSVLAELLGEAKPTTEKKPRREYFKRPALNAPLVCGGLMIVATEAGTLEVRKLPGEKSDAPAEPAWEWKSPSGAEIQTAPAAAGGFIVVGSDDGHLYGFSYVK